MNDIFQFEMLGEGPDGKLFGHYNSQPGAAVVPAPPVVFRARPAVEGCTGRSETPPCMLGLQWILLILSCLSLAGLGLSGFLVSRAQNYRQKRDARLAMVVTPHVRVQKTEISAFTRSTEAA